VESHATDDLYAPKTIVVADDDPEMSELIAAVMAKRGYSVIEFGDGHDVFAHIVDVMAGKAPAPSLVVSDLRMPGMTGLEIIVALQGSGLDVPVILITAFGDSETHARARDLGAAFILDKPFEMAELVAAIAIAIPA
jgi:DNA-binding response OmpR family regulator